METVTDEKSKRRAKKRPGTLTDYGVVPLTSVRKNPKKPRTTFNRIEDLAASIAPVGQIVPGLARPYPTEPDAFAG